MMSGGGGLMQGGAAQGRRGAHARRERDRVKTTTTRTARASSQERNPPTNQLLPNHPLETQTTQINSPKIHRALPEFLCEFPDLPAPAARWPASLPAPPAADWAALLAEVRSRGAAVPEVEWCRPGEDGARDALLVRRTGGVVWGGPKGGGGVALLLRCV